MSKALFAAGVRPRQGPVRAQAHLLSDEDVLDAIRGEPPATPDWSPSRARNAGQQWRADRYHRRSGVAQARDAGDTDALRGSLVDLAAAALWWADAVTTHQASNHRIAA
jgi:hypothetical protein